MKIKLSNRSNVRDSDIRTLVKEACKQVGARVETLNLEVGKSGHAHGRATCSGRRTLWIECNMWLWVGPDLDSFKRVVIHEAMHLAGAKHNTMTPEQRWCTFELPEWAKALPLRDKEVVVHEETKTAAFHTERLEHLRAMHSRAVTRLKRAQTIEKKWKRRLDRAEKSLPIK